MTRAIGGVVLFTDFNGNVIDRRIDLILHRDGASEIRLTDQQTGEIHSLKDNVGSHVEEIMDVLNHGFIMERSHLTPGGFRTISVESP